MMKNLLLYPSCKQGIVRRYSFFLSILLIVIGLGRVNQTQAQIYFHNFGTTTITSHPYTLSPTATTVPGILNANLSNSSWSNSTGAWTSFTGNGGAPSQAIAINNCSGTPTFTLTFDVAAGYQLSVTSFNFWRQRSTSGATNWSMTINGISVGAGTTPTSGALIGNTAVSNAVNNLTGTITVVLTLSGGSSTGTFRLDDFTLNGTVILGPTLSADTPTGFGNVCINNTTGANTFNITGTTLSAANLTVGPLAGYQFSLTNGSFTDSISFSLPGNQTQQIYVVFNPTIVQSYNGNIPISGGGATAISTAVTGAGVNTKPTITNGTVSGITTSAATIAATISTIGCTAISGYGIEYSTTAGFVNGTGTTIAGTNLLGGNFSVGLTGLAPAGTTFYVHVYATNAGGTTYGTEISFTLLNTVPTLSVPAAGAGSLSPFGNVCINTASTNSFNLSGNLLNGSNITIGALSNYTFSTSLSGTYTSTLTLTTSGTDYSYTGGVLSGCTIYVKFIPTAVQSYNGSITISGGGAGAINVAASAAGINTVPSVTAAGAFALTTSSAILPGTLVSGGCGVLLNYGFEYSNAPFTPGTGTIVNANNLAGSNFSYNLTGLTPGTTYYYYAFATNSGGTSYSTQLSFSTPAVPTKLVIISVSPASPIALTPFSVTVQAQDNAGNPVEVPTETDIVLNQFAGSGVFTFPNAPLEAGTLFEGNSTVTITDVSYSIVENNVALTATASTGMTGLGTSVPFYFNVIAYTGPNNFIWSNAGGSTWLTGSNWLPGTAPGSTTTPGTNAHLASFTSQANLLTSAVGGCGINMNTANGVLNVGAIYFAETYNFAHTGDVVYLGNNSTTQDGTLYLYGTALNTVGGISGNNYASLLLANYMNNATTKTLEIRNTMGGGSKFMTLNIANAGSIVAGVGRTINLHTYMTGSGNITFAGGGTFSMNPSGFASVNTYSGSITVANGILLVGNTGVFNTTTPNAVTLGAGTTAGVLRLNGNSVTIGALANAGSAGVNNIIDNGNTSATLTVNSAANTNFNGSLKNGSGGTLSLIKNGTGSLTLGGLNTYTGLTTLNAGTLRINYGPGNGLPVTNSITVNGGTLRISTDQTIANLTLTAGTLTIDAGATLTITGTYTPGTCSINNNGTIKLQGGASQTFPGVSTTVNTMNNLTINNIFGVSMNKSLSVTGVLTLTAGTFLIGANTLTIQNPIAGTPNNLAGDQTSSMVIAGTAAGVNIPASITQLNNLTVSNTSGTTLQGNLNVKTAVQISSTAGTVYTGLNTFNGTANLSMQGGNLYMEKNGVVLPEFSGAYSLTGGTVTFAGVGISTDAQTVRPINYFNLVSDLDGDRILNNTGTIGVLNNFVPSTSPYSNAYTITGSTVDFIKASAGQTIPAFTYYNIRVSGGSAVTKTLSGHINIVNSLIMATNTKLSLDNFNVTLKSTQTQTASVDVIPTANSFTYGGTGRFVVERFIGTGVVHNKGWQLLAVPTTGQTVKQAWQENAANVSANPSPGYGIQITSDLAGATALGFDIATPTGSGPGMKTYNSTTNNYTGIANTNALALYNKKGYLVFVRGDRTVTTSAQAATTTILRSTGKIFSPGTDAPASTTVAAGKFESVGNPYPSAIDFTSVLSGSSGIDAKFYVWDPSYPGTQGYGGFQSMSSADGYLPHPGGSTYYPTGTPVTKIQSGQAFLVYSTAGGTLNFTEANKTSGSSLVARQQQIKTTLNGWLYKNNGQLVDGNAIVFDAAYSNALDPQDADKFTNGGEALGILVNDRRLAIEARNLPVITDTIQFYTSGLRQQSYVLAIATQNWAATGTVAFLVDRFTGMRTALVSADVTNYEFAVTSDPASQQSNRFIIVFQSLRPVPVSYVELTGSRTRNAGIQLNWKAANETDMQQYQLQRKTIRGDWQTIDHQTALNNQQAITNYAYLDAAAGNETLQYRVLAQGLDQRIQYSNVISFGKLIVQPAIQILQNPVQQSVVRIRYEDLATGKYQVQLVDESGKLVWKQAIVISQPVGNLALPLTTALASGFYHISVTGDQTNWQSNLILE